MVVVSRNTTLSELEEAEKLEHYLKLRCSSANQLLRYE